MLFHSTRARRAALLPGLLLTLAACAPRPWHVGVLYADDDDRLSRRLIAQLEAEGDLCVGDNEPYAGALPGDAIDRHALQLGRHNTLIEVRNDLIGSATAQAEWGLRLAAVLNRVLEDMA